jgi:hypothetical protein
MMFRRLCRWRVAIALLLTPLGTSHSFSAERVARWVRSTDGDWFDSSNWDIGISPNNLGSDIFDVQWDAYPVNLTLDTRAVSIRNFLFSSGGTLTGSGNLSITDDFNWSGGTMRGPDNSIAFTSLNGVATLKASPGQRLTLRNRGLTLGKISTLHSPLYLETVGTPPFPTTVEIGGFTVCRMDQGAEFRAFPPKTNIVYNFGTLHILPGSVAFISEAAISSHREVILDDRTMSFSAEVGLTLEGPESKLTLNGGRISGVAPDGGIVTGVAGPDHRFRGNWQRTDRRRAGESRES